MALRKEAFEDLPRQYALVTEHDLVPLAQIHDSFIIAQSKEGMAIVDQHAAHERVLFEKLQDQFGGGMMPLQNLLVPIQVELGPAQSGLLSEYLVELHSMGFIVEDFGNGTFVIKAVPSLVVGADYRKLLLDVLDEVAPLRHGLPSCDQGAPATRPEGDGDASPQSLRVPHALHLPARQADGDTALPG